MFRHEEWYLEPKNEKAEIRFSLHTAGIGHVPTMCLVGRKIKTKKLLPVDKGIALDAFEIARDNEEIELNVWVQGPKDVAAKLYEPWVAVVTGGGEEDLTPSTSDPTSDQQLALPFAGPVTKG